MHLLEQRWPALSALPYARIAELPTPAETLGGDVLFSAEPVSTWPSSLAVKRDDLTSPVYGGNKVRKLEFLLGDAQERGARSVITFGAYGSNHALATAVHATRLGLEPHVVLTPQAPSRFAPATLLAHAGVGTRIHLAESGYAAVRVAAKVRAELLARDGVEPYVIAMGGSSAVGAVGYVNAALELLDEGPGGLGAPDLVYVAAGTLGTAVGLAIGFAAVDAPTRVIALRVTPESVANHAIAVKLANQTVALLRSYDDSFPELGFDDLRLDLRDDQYGEDYAVPTLQALEAASRAEEAGLHLETTYTAKALAGLIADGRAGRLAGKRVVFLDTYSSAPKPAAGDEAELPEPLREYLRECEALG